ncbi:MAG: FecR family protein [Bacteroidota bacterium]
MNDNEEIITLLVKYITGETTEKETVLVKNWVKAHPENEQFFAELYETWHNSLSINADEVIDTDKAYELFIKRTSYQVPEVHRSKKWTIFTSTIVALFVVLTVLWLYRPMPNASLNRLAAAPGKITKITLTDGTVVWLNSGSVLKYGSDFGRTTRTVYLEGEGYFDIAHSKKDIPFMVHTKNYIIRDIGTRFNLKAYPNDPFFETSVVNGEVSIEDKAQKDNATNRIYIKQKQTLRIWKRGKDHNAHDLTGFNNAAAKNYNDIQITQFSSDSEEKYIGWKDDLLVFDNNTMDDIARVLERRYNVRIDIADSTLQHIRYTGNFKNVKTIGSVLGIIKQNTPITYSVSRDGLITIKKEKN